jgi:biopolymer transport protein ExbD
MSWKVRHEGSPRTIDNLSPGQIAQGLEEGLWEPTDEVQGPNDSTWVPIESHPVFAEVAEDLDLTPEAKPDEGTHLDMTALIDVCLVLLVFFILTTGYAALQKMLELGNVDFHDKNKVKVVKQEQLNELALMISVQMEDGKPVIRLESEKVAPEDLPARLSSLVQQTRKVTVAVKYDNDVPWGSVVPIHDAAKLARIQDAVIWIIPKEFLTHEPKPVP